MESSTKNLAANCQICGRDAETHCFGVSTCNECRQFFHEQSKRNTTGSCSKKKQCFVEKTKKSFWKVSSGCRSCRYERMVFLGMLELKKMKQSAHVPVSTLSNVMESLPNNGRTSSAPEEPSTSRSAEDGFFRCKVCEGQENVSKRYGALVCNTCAMFFVRSWKEVNKTPLQCLLQGESEGFCPLRRDCPPLCRLCRVKRCVELEMKCQMPLTLNSPVDEMMKILDTTDYEDFADQPLPGPESPLFEIKEEVQEEDLPDNLCKVCETYPINHHGHPVCTPCGLFFTRSYKEEATFEADCATKTCDLRWHVNRCSFCRLLQCLRFGMTVQPGDVITKNSQLHRILIDGKESGWKWLNEIPPEQILPQFLENDPPCKVVPRRSMCDVGMSFYNGTLQEVGKSSMICPKCEKFFDGCCVEEKSGFELCTSGCHLTCHRNSCASCKLKRCLEVGMAGIWKKKTFFAHFLANWHDKQLPENTEFCACGRIIEGESDECTNCASEKLLKLVREAAKGGNDKRESQVDRLCREGLAARLPYSENAAPFPRSPEIVQIDSSDEEETSAHSQMIMEHGEDGMDPKENMRNTRKRKLSVSNVHTGSPKVQRRMAVKEDICLVCGGTESVEERYNTIVCEPCSWFFCNSLSKEKDGGYVCNRERGDPSCDLNVVEREKCDRCRLLKWISLNPLLPKFPFASSPLQYIVDVEQVAELIPEEKGSFRVDAIKDNLKLAKEKRFAKENARQRKVFDEAGADSQEDGSICDEREGKDEEEEEDLREEWLKRDAKSPCAVCGTVRRPREKTLGPPACLRCVTFVSECWDKKFCPDSLKCLKMTGKVGECSLSWKFRLCVLCQLRRSLKVGCSMGCEPAVGSVVHALILGNFEVELAAEQDEIRQKEDSSNEDIDGASGGGACAGCGDQKSSIHYNVLMCRVCHSFIRNSMRATAVFSPCLRINKAIGACSTDIHPALGKFCPYCRLKRLLSGGIRLCEENIKGTPVQQMLCLEKINVEFVSGGSYTSKSSMIQVQTEFCAVCSHHRAVTHFHNVFLCKGCRTFIMNQWNSQYALCCSNPLDNEKCKQLIAQQCQLCRLMSCIRVGARSNGPPHQKSFILRLCPGYPEKKMIDERLFKLVVNKSIQRQMTIFGSKTCGAPQELSQQPLDADVKEEDPNIVLASSNQYSSSSLALQGDAISAESLLGEDDEDFIEEESAPQPVAEDKGAEDDEHKDHVFDLGKDIPQKIDDFFASFTHWLKPRDKMNSRASLEKTDCMRGWKCIIIQLEPFFEAFQEWSETVGWMQNLPLGRRDKILSANCMEAAALIASYMLNLHSCIPYDEDKLLLLPDLIELLEETSDSESQTEILTTLLDCASQMKRMNIMNHVLPLLMNIIMVENAGFAEEIVEEYYRECREFLCKQDLEANSFDLLHALVRKLIHAGKLFRITLGDFCASRNTTILSFPPLAKKFLNLL